MIVAGGGTGGHLFPGLAVAEEVAARGAEVLFVGSAFGIEATAVPQTRFRFEPIVVRGARGRGLRGLIEFAGQFPAAVRRARHLVRETRPDVVLGLGGYGSVPVVVAAWSLGVPSVLMEQNVHPGLANRCLAHVARRVCTTFRESAAFFPAGKAVQTGNPVRRLVAAEVPRSEAFTIFVFGGSQGAHTINVAAVDAAGILREKLCKLRIVHQTGAADESWVRRRYQEMGVAAEVLPFVHDMGTAYGQADVVVCRAGATTLAELASVGRPAILVPYPYAADDHQRRNAEVLAQGGAAEVVLDRDLNGALLAERILALAADTPRLRSMAVAARRFARPDAAAQVADICRQVAGARR
ncbi:undecaprenyldiphospho-muramoylpentapeptide beta-N-acetylglucosaminyltransferase [Candidatus Binatia bacterium]|nr:undecaprenyldiphospho-muramoylpentapeptide beta-N-acetylglucosaminyltransferase [Candidatus Binatia bacterium]